MRGEEIVAGLVAVPPEFAHFSSTRLAVVPVV
jgi:hypothetical protein